MPWGEITGLVAAFMWAIASFLWMRVHDRLDPFAMNFAKSAAGAGGLALFCYFRSGSPFPLVADLETLWLLFLSAFIGMVVGDIFYYMGLLRLGARRTLLMLLVTPGIGALLGRLFLGEVIPLLGWIGMIITLIGIGFVQTERALEIRGKKTPFAPDSRRTLLVGSAMILFACIGQATGAMFAKDVLNRGLDPIHVVLGRLAICAAVMTLAGLFSGKIFAWVRIYRPPGVAAYSAGAICLGTFLGLSFMTISQKLIPIGLSITLCCTAPLFGLPLAVLFRETRITFRMVIGTIIAFVGVVLIFL